jgi:peptide chain release factor subunit 3
VLKISSDKPVTESQKDSVSSIPVTKPETPEPKQKKKEEKKPEPKKEDGKEDDKEEVELVEDVVDDETLTEFYGKEHLNIVFIGHVGV